MTSTGAGPPPDDELDPDILEELEFWGGPAELGDNPAEPGQQ